MKQFIALFAFALVVNAYDNIEARTQWLQFKAQHGKSYKNLVEETTRFQVFQENLKQIEQHNAKYEAGLSTWKMGVTQFADQTPEEFVESLKTNRPTTGEIKIKKSVPHKDFIVIDDEIDWRKQGAVSPVKNTGVCGCTNSVAAASIIIITHRQNPKQPYSFPFSGRWTRNPMVPEIRRHGIVQ